MKHNKLSVQTLGVKNMSKVLYIALITAMALFMTSSVAQSFNGFASYQDYLNNYYAQNNQQQSRATTVIPAIQTLPNTNTNSFNGFASYQDYLNNYYASQNVRSTSVNVNPCGFQNLLSLFVFGDNNCVSLTSPTRNFITPLTNTNHFSGYNSYDEFMRAVYGNNYTLGSRSGTTSSNHFSGYNSYNEFIQAVYGNNNTVGRFTGITPTLPPTPSTSLNQSYELSVGQSYQLSNGLIMTVQTLNDNRCPLNVACIWQGDITATVRLEMGNDIRTITVSMVEGAQAPQVTVNNASIHFVGLGQNTNTVSTYVSIN